jgi:galactokinase
VSAWFAPGRANIMGEHTDYNEGLVLPFALAQGVTATAAARPDGLLVMRSKQMPGEPVAVDLASLAPGAVGGWAAYPAGVAWSLAAAGYPVGGADVDIDSDLPVGAGISSSAAVECSVALALCELGGFTVGRRELAAIARRAENDFVGAPTGIIDQYASLLCQADHAMLLDCRTREIRQVPFRPAADGMVTLIIDTKVPHALADGQYAVRRAECEEAARRIGVPSLGSVPAADAAGALRRLAGDPVLLRRARHVITDSARARAIADALSAQASPRSAAEGRSPGHASLARGAPGLPEFIGNLLTEGHESLRADFEVSWEAADVTVATAASAGAAGAKMIGGGFGGSVLALVPADAQPGVRAAVAAEFARRGWEAPRFLEAAPSPAARKLASRALKVAGTSRAPARAARDARNSRLARIPASMAWSLA